MILYSGNDIDAFAYDSFTDSHSNVLKFDSYRYRHKNKILFVNNHRAYIAVTDKEIYESYIDDPYNWSIFMKNFGVPTNGLISSCLLIDDTVCMIFEDYFVYKLDLKKKRTRRVMSIN